VYIFSDFFFLNSDSLEAYFSLTYRGYFNKTTAMTFITATKKYYLCKQKNLRADCRKKLQTIVPAHFRARPPLSVLTKMMKKRVQIKEREKYRSR